ncbi:MAG: hypothetical protein PHS96_07925 [Anaerolineales bacterium]|nr:hypothetical protein [Anaerolineales bacterium]MDD5467721.1 hypothetical protein [Anaerolineales bacterium]
MTTPNFMPNAPLPHELKLKKLTLEQVKRIDEMLASVGDYGEVHLIVQRGELRYINQVTSYKTWEHKIEK